MADFVPRALSKAWYVTSHAWLLLFPVHLSCDWSGNRFARVLQ